MDLKGLESDLIHPLKKMQLIALVDVRVFTCFLQQWVNTVSRRVIPSFKYTCMYKWSTSSATLWLLNPDLLGDSSDLTQKLSLSHTAWIPSDKQTQTPENIAGDKKSPKIFILANTTYSSSDWSLKNLCWWDLKQNDNATKTKQEECETESLFIII